MAGIWGAVESGFRMGQQKRRMGLIEQSAKREERNFQNSLMQFSIEQQMREQALAAQQQQYLESQDKLAWEKLRPMYPKEGFQSTEELSTALRFIKAQVPDARIEPMIKQIGDTYGKEAVVAQFNKMAQEQFAQRPFVLKDTERMMMEQDGKYKELIPSVKRETKPTKPSYKTYKLKDGTYKDIKRGEPVPEGAVPSDKVQKESSAKEIMQIKNTLMELKDDEPEFEASAIDFNNRNYNNQVAFIKKGTFGDFYDDEGVIKTLPQGAIENGWTPKIVQETADRAGVPIEEVFNKSENILAEKLVGETVYRWNKKLGIWKQPEE